MKLRKGFSKRVEHYAAELREWLIAYEAYQREVSLIFRSDLRFENRGRVAARDVRVQLRFPNAFQAVEEYPELEERPSRPQPPKRGLAALVGFPTPEFRLPDTSRFPADHGSGSRQRLSSALPPGFSPRRLQGHKLLHGVPEETEDPIMLRIEEDGQYEIPREIHAENLAEPTTGTLVLTVVTESVDHPDVTRLDQLARAGEAENGDVNETS